MIQKVKFLPKKDIDIPIEVCDHRFGAEMTFSHQTDSRLVTSIYAAELYGFKNNIRLGNFITNVLGQNNSGIKDVENTGVIKHDIYFSTDSWLNPNTGVVEYIPDYYNLVWSSAGASFFNVIEGDVKISKFPNHGQQLFDLSNGVYGYDFSSNVSGSSNLAELKGVSDKQQEIINTLGKTTCAGSYRNGVRNAADLMPAYFLGMRNSAENHTGNSDTYYGSDLGNNTLGVTDVRQFFKNYPSSTRWWDTFTHGSVDKTVISEYVVSEIQKTILNKGWYRDFCHWHSLRNLDVLPELDEFLQLVNTAFGNSFVWTCSNGEALEYMFLRESVDKVLAKRIEGGKIFVLIDVIDSFKNVIDINGIDNTLHLKQLHTPLSVKIDLSNTNLSGKNVKSSFGKIRSLGNDVYIIQIPFNFKEDFKGVVLSEGNNGVFNEDIPIVQKDISNNNMKIYTDIPTKAVLFRATQGSAEYDFLPIARSNDFLGVHSFDYDSNYDYKIGVISEFGKTNLIN